MRTTITIDEKLLKEIKKEAAMRNSTVSGVIQAAVQKFLTEEHRAMKQMPPFKLITVKGKPLPPHVDLDRTSSFLAAEDKARYGNRKDRRT